MSDHLHVKTIDDYYDGILSGLGRYKGRYVYFICYALGECIPQDNKCFWTPRIYQLKSAGFADVLTLKLLDASFSVMRLSAIALKLYPYKLSNSFFYKFKAKKTIGAVFEYEISHD